MLQRVENVKLAILEAIVKGFYECSFAVGVGEKSIGPFLISYRNFIFQSFIFFYFTPYKAFTQVSTSRRTIDKQSLS